MGKGEQKLCCFSLVTVWGWYTLWIGLTSEVAFSQAVQNQTVQRHEEHPSWHRILNECWINAWTHIQRWFNIMYLLGCARFDDSILYITCIWMLTTNLMVFVPNLQYVSLNAAYKHNKVYFLFKGVMSYHFAQIWKRWKIGLKLILK
jgi:hypothetical protein